ncbi:MAG: F0F1 ATP synthase subunit B [Acidobacteria bacterium]|nr:F0F1 ATP synthase subunit B [Acidobacteriota bacterium]
MLAVLAATGDNPLLRVNPGLWLWTLIVFLVLLAVLYRYGWGMMISALDKRDKAIRGSIEQARHDRDEAQRLLEEHKALLDKGRRESAEMIAAAQKEAGRERARLVQEAREEYERIVARGREQIEQETRGALTQIRSTVADLAVDVASRLLRHNLDEPNQRALAERFVSELEKR